MDRDRAIQELAAVFKSDSLFVSDVRDKLVEHLLPCKPIQVDYNLTSSSVPTTRYSSQAINRAGGKAFDINVDVEDHFAHEIVSVVNEICEKEVEAQEEINSMEPKFNFLVHSIVKASNTIADLRVLEADPLLTGASSAFASSSTISAKCARSLASTSLARRRLADPTVALARGDFAAVTHLLSAGADVIARSSDAFSLISKRHATRDFDKDFTTLSKFSKHPKPGGTGTGAGSGLSGKDMEGGGKSEKAETQHQHVQQQPIKAETGAKAVGRSDHVTINTSNEAKLSDESGEAAATTSTSPININCSGSSSSAMDVETAEKVATAEGTTDDPTHTSASASASSSSSAVSADKSSSSSSSSSIGLTKLEGGAEASTHAASATSSAPPSASEEKQQHPQQGEVAEEKEEVVVVVEVEEEEEDYVPRGVIRLLPRAPEMMSGIHSLNGFLDVGDDALFAPQEPWVLATAKAKLK